MLKLHVHHAGQLTLVPFAPGSLLSGVLREAGFTVHTPCGGKGICGRCGIKASGDMQPKPQKGIALACKTKLMGACSVWLEDNKKLTNITMAGLLPQMDLNPMGNGYGLAVDIGTTTIAVMLLELSTGRQVAAAAAGNPQTALSDNVIGRITCAMDGQGVLLQGLVNEQINALEEQVCKQAGITSTLISKRVITGNTAMLYFLMGYDPLSLSKAPFRSEHLFDEWVGDTYLPQCIGAFLGADLLTAILASGMCQHEHTALLADIGTNGEIALWHKGRLYCAAAAAGPAFEGGGISQGQGSVHGAIDTASAQTGKLHFTTIENAPAIGICGSGLIDLAAALLELETMDETGRLEEDPVLMTEQVGLTQADIRKLQLAKGAVAAAIGTLCQAAGISINDMDHFYLAGGFGTHMNAVSAAKIGLIPDALKERAIPLGNAALTGAAMLLIDQNQIEQSLKLAKMAEKVTLSGNAVFADLFTQRMFFEPF